MTSLVLYISLIFGTFVNSQHSPLNVITQLPDHIIPIHYNINLSLETIEKRFFTGTCHIRIRIDWPTYNIWLHAQESHIKLYSIVLDRVNSSFSIEPKSYSWCFGDNHVLIIYFINSISRGYYDLKIDFMTTLNNNEKYLFKISYSNKEQSKVWSIGTHFNAIGARRIFPCWDEPRFNATFNISIKHLSEHTVLLNIPEKMKNVQHDLTWIQFDETSQIPPYFVEIVVFNFRIVKRIIFQCRQQAALHLKYAEMFIENVTLYLESQWRFCKTPEKIVHIAIPDTFYPDIMQKLDFVLYRETALIYDENLEPFIRKIDVTRFIGRAVAIHQCFDNLFSPISWLYLWLYEGIFTLYTAHAINKIYPEFRIWDLFVVQIQQESLRLDTYSIMKPLMSEARTEFNLLLSFTYFIKAPAILRMFQHAVGYEVFWKGIEIFLSRQVIKRSLNFNDLWTAMQIILDNSNNAENKFNIKNLIMSWTQINYYPVLNVNQYNFSHKIIFNENASNQIEIPITYTTRGIRNFNCFLPCTIFSSFDIYNNGISLRSYSDEWMIVNLQQTGYYRVNYDATCWGRIVHYLNTPHEFTNIHILNRAQIIDDAFYFLMNGQLPLSTFMNLTKYLQNETDYIAWYPMIKALEHVSGFFLLEQNEMFKVHMQNILHVLLNDITYTEKSDEKPNDFIKCLRNEAAKWACILGDSECKYTATIKLMSYLISNERPLPGWKRWTYCNGLMKSDLRVWWTVFQKWISTSDTELLEYLSYSASPNIIRNYLNIIVNKSENCGPNMIDCKDVRMQPNDRINSFLFIIARHAKNNEILEYILRNLQGITPIEVNMRVALITIINYVQSETQLFMIDDTMDRIGYYIDVPTRIVREKIDARLLEIMNERKYFRRLIV